MKLITLVTAQVQLLVASNVMATVKNWQTAAEIKMHVKTSTADEFCFNKVENPGVSLFTGKVIPYIDQLKVNLEVAFLNTRKNFSDAQASCASLGYGWHAPASVSIDAYPQATNNTNSVEAVGSYFMGTTDQSFWSSSTVQAPFLLFEDLFIIHHLWSTFIAYGYPYGYYFKYFSNYVVCVRP